MNWSKKLYILLVFLIVACAATLGVMQLEERREQIKNSEDIILEVPMDSVQSLSWEYGETALAFHKDGIWLYDEDETFPVSEERIEELLSQFEAFVVSFVIEDVEDYGQYGLENPTCTIDLTTEDQSYQVLVGNYSNMDSKRYVSIGDGNVYLVQNDPLDYFDTGLSDLIDNDETPSFDKITGVQFAGTENYSIRYEEDSTNTYSADDVYFAQQDGKSLPLDTSRVDSYLQLVSSLLLTNYVSYDAGDGELQTYGLDAPDLTVTVDYTAEGEDGNEEQNTFVLHVSRDPKETQEAEEAAANGEEEFADEAVTAYVRVEESKIIYKISSSTYKSLMVAAYDDLRHQEVFWADFADVQQIDISLEGESYTITSEKENDDHIYAYQDEELEIGDLQNALEALTADSFTDEKPAQKEEIGLTIYLDHENYPQISIKLYRFDGTCCLAAVDGQPVSLVERNAVVDLIEAVHAIVLS